MFTVRKTFIAFPLLLIGADQEGRQLGACSEMVQGRPQNHRVSDSHRGDARVPRGTLHAAVRGVDVSGHGPCSAAGATRVKWVWRRSSIYFCVVYLVFGVRVFFPLSADFTGYPDRLEQNIYADGAVWVMRLRGHCWRVRVWVPPFDILFMRVVSRYLIMTYLLGRRNLVSAILFRLCLRCNIFSMVVLAPSSTPPNVCTCLPLNHEPVSEKVTLYQLYYTRRRS